jgi:hypothetical protein
LQPLLIIFGAGLTLAASYGLGSRLLAADAADPGVRIVSGAAILSTVVFLCGLLGFARPAVFLAIGLAAVALVRLRAKRAVWFDRRWWLVFGPFLVLYLSNAMAPEISFDGSRYHLGLVARYWREHGIHPVVDSFYAALGQGVEMLYLFAFSFGRHSAASMVHFGLLLTLVWQMIAWARRAGQPLAGVAAAALVFLSPMVGVDASSAYVDVAVAAIVFTLFHVLWLWREQRSTRLLIGAGLLAGFAYAAKYSAAPAILYAMVWVAWTSRRLRDVAVVAAAAGGVVLPWILRNWLWYGNPLAPFFNRWFPNPYVSISFEEQYRLQLRHWNGADGVIGPVFLLAPVAFLAMRSAIGRRLLLAAAVFGSAILADASPRFLIPALPFVALAMCLPLARAPRLLIGIVAVHTVLSWPTVLRLYCRPDAWRLDKVTYREALRIKPEEGFLESNLPLYGAARLVDRVTPPDATIFTQTPIPEAYTSRHIQTAYQSAGNIHSRDILWSGFVPEHAPTSRLKFAFSPRSLTGIRLMQEGAGQGTWSIHELRAFQGGRELPRTGWTATAHPSPWGAAAILDGRLASFWQSGDPIRPGQTVDVGFGGAVSLDTVVVECAPDQPAVRLKLGEAAPEISGVPIPAGMRRAAAEELHRRGIGYLLAFDGEFGAADLRTHAVEWGIREIGQYKGARIYQLP